MVPVAVLLCLARAAAGQWTLNDGTKISFVFVKPSEKQAWRPSGELVPYESLPKPTAPVWTGKEEEPVLVALLNPPHRLAAPPHVRFKLPASTELNSTFTAVCSDGKIWMAGYRPLTRQPSMQDLAIGVANGGWRVLSWVEYRKTGHMVHALKVHGSPLRLSVTGTAVGRTAQPYIFVNVPASSDLDNVSYRFVVRDVQGREMPYDGMVTAQSENGAKAFRFEGNVEDVSQVILQVRTYEWHTLRVAHFRPNSN